MKRPNREQALRDAETLRDGVTGPVSLEHTMEGRAFAAPLFQRLPLEVLDEVVASMGDLRRQDLASLALANSDCRQMARSWQFRNVALFVKRDLLAGVMYSEPDDGLLCKLQTEALERHLLSVGNKMRSPSLGACVQHLRIGQKHWMQKNVYYRPPFQRPNGQTNHGHLTFAQWEETRHSLAPETSSIPSSLFILGSLPHVRYFTQWGLLSDRRSGPIEMNQTALNTLAGSTVRHLRTVLVQTACAPRLAPGVQWPLETLHLQIGGLSPDRAMTMRGIALEQVESELCTNLLRPCAATLQALVLHVAGRWHLDSSTKKKRRNIAFNLEFPEVRSMKLVDKEVSLTAPAIRSLLLTSPHLSHLVLDADYGAFEQALGDTESIPSLKTVELRCARIDLPYYSKNLGRLVRKLGPQLTAFATPYHIKAEYLYPAFKFLAGSQLTKLWFSMDERTGARQMILSELANMTCLEELQINVKEWHVHSHAHHASFINILGSQLRKLRHLAFTTPPKVDIQEELSGVYGAPSLERLGWLCSGVTALTPRPSRSSIAEQRKQKTAVAVDYARAFPRLEFVHIQRISYVELIRDAGRVSMCKTQDGLDGLPMWTGDNFAREGWKPLVQHCEGTIVDMRGTHWDLIRCPE